MSAGFGLYEWPCRIAAILEPSLYRAELYRRRHRAKMDAIPVPLSLHVSSPGCYLSEALSI